MAINLSSLKRSGQIDPPKMILYGINGVGKTSFAAQAPNPVFILTEKGLGALKVDYFPQAQSWEDVVQALDSLLNEDHKFNTVVIDSLDWLERLIFNRVAADEGKASIEDIGFGKGYTYAQNYWYDFTLRLDKLNEQKRMAIILIGHSLVKTFNSPDTDNYDRYRLDLHDKSAGILRDWADIMLFANYKAYTKTVDAGFNRKDHKGIGDGQRILYTEERPAFWAKNRYNLPFEIPLSRTDGWNNFASALGASLAAIDATPEVVK